MLQSKDTEGEAYQLMAFHSGHAAPNPPATSPGAAGVPYPASSMPMLAAAPMAPRMLPAQNTVMMQMQTASGMQPSAAMPPSHHARMPPNGIPAAMRGYAPNMQMAPGAMPVSTAPFGRDSQHAMGIGMSSAVAAVPAYATATAAAGLEPATARPPTALEVGSE